MEQKGVEYWLGVRAARRLMAQEANYAAGYAAALELMKKEEEEEKTKVKEEEK